MATKEKQLSIRLSEDLHRKSTNQAKDMKISLAELIRISLDSHVTHLGSDPIPNDNSLLKSQIEELNDARYRADQIIMQLSKQIERQHIQIEDLTKPKSFWLKLKSVVS